MKTLNRTFLNKYDLFIKYLVVDWMTYLQQKYTRHSNHADIGYYQCYNELVPLH